MTPNRPGAVVVGAHVNGLTVARAPARSGIRVAVLRTRDWDIAHVSRTVLQAIDVKDFPTRPEVLLDLLAARQADWRGWAVYPTDDLSLKFLLEHRHRLRRASYVVIAPPIDAARTLLDKGQTSQLAKRIGVALPYDYGATDSPMIDPQKLRYPVVVKPNDRHRFCAAFDGRKVFFARDASQLKASQQKLADAGLTGRVLEFLPGPDSLFFNFSVYVNGKGEPVAGFPMRKERKSPPFFGVCRVAHTEVSSKHAKTMRDSVIAMLQAIDYRGMANAEFKLDERDGTLRLMEINARPFLMQGLPLRAGLNYARMAWQEFVTSEEPWAEDNGWRGAWIHLHADLGNSLAHRRSENLRISEYLRPYRRRRTYAVWSATDPLPFFLQWSRTLLRMPLRVVREKRKLHSSLRTDTIR